MPCADLFIFEMANNHQGDLGHAKKIIDNCSELAKKYNLKAGVKFQFRHLDTFIEKESVDGHYTKRFQDTRLEDKDFKELIDYVKSKDLISIATVFDENSIQLFKDLDVEILKIASCSAADYPLLSALSDLDCPTILSTGGLDYEKINRAVSYLKRDPKMLSLMHCTSLYPTEIEQLNLHRISDLKRIFSENKIGFSTHENPSNYDAVFAAKILGAQIFEKHVALETKEYKVNKYSATPEQLEMWIQSYLKACDYSTRISNTDSEKELEALLKLSRGLFFEDDIVKTQFPCRENQVKVYDLYRVEGFSVIEQNRVLDHADIEVSKNYELEILDRLTFLLRRSEYRLNKKCSGEISIHYGIDKFEETGAILISLFEDNLYKRKIICMFKDQFHPEHKHSDRSELITVIKGSLELTYNSETFTLVEGESFSIDKDSTHSFKALDDLIVEEVVLQNKSIESVSDYTDLDITNNDNRKIKFEIDTNFNFDLMKR